MTTRQIPSEEQVIGWMDSLSNWAVGEPTTRWVP